MQGSRVVAALLLGLVSMGLCDMARAQAAAPNPPARLAVEGWVFKPKNAPYVAPNKPLWRIADIVAAKKGKADWAQMVLNDQWFRVQYISMGAGKKTPRVMEADTITWFIVQAGQIRFSVDGQDPVVAGPDSIVQIPARTAYVMETVSDQPSVRLEAHVAGAAQIYPIADNPTPPPAPPGFEAVRVNAGAPRGSLGQARFLDYKKDVLDNPTPAPRAPGSDNFFVRDARGFVVPIRSAGGPMPAPEVLGHFHLGVSEWWYVLEGDMNVRIEGVGVVEAHRGDLVYAPSGRYHRTVMVGKPMSTRVAMGGVTDSGASFVEPGVPGN